jgi:hypothetical protein|tara:strand:- start:2249 stop:2449 length:201 start_codon:yes stop_codon:yes gene_type:complete
MSINKDFAEIVHNSLGDIDEKGDAIIFQEKEEAKVFYDQLPPLVFPFGYMIISSTFMYYDEEEEDE